MEEGDTATKLAKLRDQYDGQDAAAGQFIDALLITIRLHLPALLPVIEAQLAALKDKPLPHLNEAATTAHANRAAAILQKFELLKGLQSAPPAPRSSRQAQPASMRKPKR